ncbi:sporulation protein YqfC [Lachnoclostridium sp. An181]|uniref:sporulation protein YqfC n=1 Tax=Lachnoclostridium sp. An181 TaxID=1965575 RepID=UPI00194EDF5C|nr:sporulation protein YqfC [Lachnoclostridium sp. An181]
MRKRETRQQLKSKVADMTNMPKDVVLGVPVLTMTGQEELYIENYRGILEYTETFIRVQTKIGNLQVVGQNLRIAYYMNDEMKINGLIKEIKYQNEIRN